MATKPLAKGTAKTKKIKPRIKALKVLYTLLVALCFTVVIWLGYHAFQRLSQGYNANTSVVGQTVIQVEMMDV